MNVEWRGVWEVRARKSEDGWSAELRIPFRSLRYPEGAGRAWGFNLYRVIRRKNEHVLLASFTRDGGGFHRVSRAGVIGAVVDVTVPVLATAVGGLAGMVLGGKRSAPASLPMSRAPAPPPTPHA